MKFRFGVQFTGAASRRAWSEAARKAEALGFSTLLVPDHLGDQLAPLPALMAAADATTALRVGTLVLANDFRHPAVLAQEAATLDLLSDGRLELGLGAGWMRAEYEAVGLPFDTGTERVARLAETLQVLRRLLDGGEVTFAGRHHRITGHTLSPRPVQGRVPLLVGGGSPQVLRAAGRHADIVGVHHDLRGGRAGAHDITPEMTDRKLAWVREGAKDRFDRLELQVGVGMFWVTDRPHNVYEGLSRRLGLPAQAIAGLPNILVGSVRQITELIVERRERFGFSYVVVQGRDIDAAAPVVAALSGT